MKDTAIDIENYKNNIKKCIEKLIDEEKLEEAKIFINNYEKIVKDDLDIFSMKAIIMIKEDKVMKAEIILNKGLEKDKNNFELNYNKAYVCEIRNDLKRAIEYYNLALKYAKDEESKAILNEIMLNIENREQHQLNKKKILIGSPIHQKPNILKEFINSLEELNSDELEINYMFIDDNDIEESSEILEEFSRKHKDVIIYKSEKTSEYNCNEDTHFWSEQIMWKVAAFKDNIIKIAVELNYDYLFLIDSDLIINPYTIKQLIKAEKDIISNIFWTKWDKSSGIFVPQVWLLDQYDQYFRYRGEEVSDEEAYRREIEFINKLKKPGVFEVGGLGACTLISRNALNSGVNFKEIKNISFIGEDRHFCIRAQALGFNLYVDTHYPAFHIYRESDLQKVEEYKKSYNIKKIDYNNIVRLAKETDNKLTLSMAIKNEANRYLREMLEEAKQYIDLAVIIDDASTDNSIEIVKEILKDIPLNIIRNEKSKFSNEILLRKQQWEETIKTKPDWILYLDADEIFEKKFAKEVKKLINQVQFDSYSFRLYDFWSKDEYRDDEFWTAHKTYRPFLLRYQENFNYIWKETAQHCGRFPMNVLQLPSAISELRLKHYGWAKKKDREEKYKRYMLLDPEGEYGIKEQYESILVAEPNLAYWKE